MNLNDAINTWGAVAPTPVIYERKSIVIPLLVSLAIGLVGFLIYNEFKKQKLIELNKYNFNRDILTK